MFNQLDFNLTVKFQNHIPKPFDVTLSIFSLIGSFEITSIILLVALVLRKKLSGMLVYGLFIITHGFEIIGKLFLKHPPPPFMFSRYDIPFLFPSSYVRPGFSYPSGHSLRTTFLFVILTTLILKMGKKRILAKTFLITLGVTFVSIMLFSRISLGEHWSTDVVGGSLLGISMGFFSLLFL